MSKFGFSFLPTRLKMLDPVTPPSPSSLSSAPPPDSTNTTPPSSDYESLPPPLSSPPLYSNGSSLPLANHSSSSPPPQQSVPSPLSKSNSHTPASPSSLTPPTSPVSNGLLSPPPPPLPSPPPPPVVNNNSPSTPSNSYSFEQPSSLSPPPPSPSPPPLVATLSPPNVTPPLPPSEFPTSPSSEYSPFLVPAQPGSPTIPVAPPSSSTSNNSNPLTSTNSTQTIPSKPSPASISNGQQLNGIQSVNPPKESSSSSVRPTPTRVSSEAGLYVGTRVIIGLSVSALVIILLLVGVVVAIKKRKTRTHAINNQYRPPVCRDPYFISPLTSPGAPGYSNESYHGHAFAAGLTDPTVSKTWFTFEEMLEITNSFSPENLIGEGGFGCVYKGWLSDGRCVAVKQLKTGSGQGEREFRAEVEIISRVHHRHLVSLVGYCIVEYHRLLVYEYVPNNTLEHHLHGHPRIIHRDIKSANILLDEAFEAQVADFGLARLSNDTASHVSTRVVGTFGYMAPEYALSGKLTDRSDVYSFGVVLLELITGRKPVDSSQPLGEESLVEWARPQLINALETGNCEQLVDPRLEGNFSKSEMFNMIEVAAACVRHSAPKRPRMVQVVRALDNDGQMLDLTNGVKFGQSTEYNSEQYSADIQQFRLMAFGSGKYSSQNGSSRDPENWSSDHIQKRD
ncbi:Non-specific serine/threonine protein kinase protein [Dioscorea alata]|uniref:Non-specific serine/threonine protein kinase protein n=1 Tax=Dioscorea alata TaxID=55571 RepID=A0ACB7UEP6_DIOAL|nr:Non-specific serine/threonine protein kinase protein [Dioscorea alata]